MEQRRALRRSRYITLALLCGSVIFFAAGAGAQPVCRAGEMPCGLRCYNPGLGQTCQSGTICYNPELGETCPR
jgi:hypothetical protein